MVKIAVFISGGGSNLASLIEHIDCGDINGKIELVVSNRMGVFGLERTKKANIPTLVTKNQTEIIEKLKTLKIDLIVLAGYLAIIPDNMIKLYPNKIINIHPSLIPAYSGPGFYGHHVHEACFKRGNKISGATVHFVNSDVDGGPIILQEAVDISDANSADEIAASVLKIEHQILPKAVKLYCENKLEVINERVKIK